MDKLHELLISYGAGIEAYCTQSAIDAANGYFQSCEDMAAQLLIIESELEKAGVDMTGEDDKRRAYVRERISELLEQIKR